MKALWFLLGFTLVLASAAQAETNPIAVCGPFTLSQKAEGEFAINGVDVKVEAKSRLSSGVTLKSDDGSVDLSLLASDVGTTAQAFWIAEDEDTTHLCKEMNADVLDELASLRKN